MHVFMQMSYHVHYYCLLVMLGVFRAFRDIAVDLTGGVGAFFLFMPRVQFVWRSALHAALATMSAFVDTFG